VIATGVTAIRICEYNLSIPDVHPERPPLEMRQPAHACPVAIAGRV
jgi:hypothetical protein